MHITSKIDAVTLFSRGAQITRLAKIELREGEHEIVLRDLPERLVQNSLRVEGKADGKADGGLCLGAVDVRPVHVANEGEGLDEASRTRLEKQIEQLEDEALDIEGHLQTAQTQKNLMDNLAAMPGSARGQKNDWGTIFDLIGERLPKAHFELNARMIERRLLQEKIDTLRGQLADQPEKPVRRSEVKISASADADLTGELSIFYQVREAGWQPLYDARLDTGSENTEPMIELVRRAAIHQNSQEPWDDVELTLSTARPSAGTSAPDLSSHVLDILPDHPPMPMVRAAKHKIMSAPIGMPDSEVATGVMPEEMIMGAAQEEETISELSRFQASFKVPGRVSLSGKGAQKKVRLGGQTLVPRLQIRGTPILDQTAFLHADFKLVEGLALLPGQVALYRDNVYVGSGHMPLVNVGERHELGFGADDAVTIKRVELKRSKGKQGLIKSENTDEFHYKITIDNHHKQAMSVRILDRLPVSNHEKLRIEQLSDMTEADFYDVDDERGILSFTSEIGAGDEHVISIHYRISWPKDQRIG